MVDHDEDVTEIRAHVDGVCAEVHVDRGSVVAAGSPVVTLESMKTEYPVTSPGPGRIVAISVGSGDQVASGQAVATVSLDSEGPADDQARGVAGRDAQEPVDRPDLAAVKERRAGLTDERRPEAVARRSAVGRRTARANVEDLLEPGSISEYGGLALASQRSRRSTEELIERTPADGLICATGTAAHSGNGHPGSEVAVLAYDATVLAGTQGFQNHRKTDRLIDIASRHRLPTVVLAEGGGGRPGDVDAPGVTGLDVTSFARFAGLAAEVPTVAVVSGYCFAGNAALAGCCDVIVATEDSNLAMAGPAMIEGAGLPAVAPGVLGPIDTQWGNGVVDVRVANDVDAIAVTKHLLSMVADAGAGPGSRSSAGPGAAGRTAHPQGPLRDLVPQRRRQAYEIREAIHTLCDPGSVIEMRCGWAPGMVTALARLDGRPVGVVANDPTHLGGAIDLEGAASAVRLLGLCERWGLPVVSLCDTPGFMVGAEEEARGQVRGFGDLFLAAARARRTLPWVTVVLRKGYGLGAQAMAGGGFHEPDLLVAWPTGEFGGMGLEGAVRLGFRRELDGIEDPAERADREAELIHRAYEQGSALSVAGHFEIDDVIDPADTRERLRRALNVSSAGAGG